jgi:hypothetical protein
MVWKYANVRTPLSKRIRLVFVEKAVYSCHSSNDHGIGNSFQFA